MNSDQKKESETRVLRRERKRKKEGIKTEWKKTNGNGAEKKKREGSKRIVSETRVFLPRSNVFPSPPLVRNRTTTSIKFVLNRATWRSGMENVISRVETLERTRVESILPQRWWHCVHPCSRNSNLCRFRCSPVNRSTRRIDAHQPCKKPVKNCKYFPLSIILVTGDIFLFFIHLFFFFLSFFLSPPSFHINFSRKTVTVCNGYIVDFSSGRGGGGGRRILQRDTFLKRI